MANQLVRWLRGTDIEERDAPVIGFGEWLQLVNQFGWNGVQYTTSESPQEQMAATYEQFAGLAYQQNGIVFACMAVRQLLFRQMRFQFRRPRDGASGVLFGDTSLKPLERPWASGTTSDLLSRAIAHHDIGGNAFFVRTQTGVNLMRPDWVDIVIGSHQDDASAAAWGMESEVIGYVYHPGGRYSGLDAVSYLASEVAHWAMYPDPLAQFRGMSWLTPIVREIMADKAASDHKLKFFENAATPNMVVKVDTDDIAKYEAYVSLFKRQKEGVGNAYSTMFTARGVDATVVGKDMAQMDFKNVQGAGEVRIAAAAGVPPVIVGLSEGLSGSSLNAGNYTAARRRLTDGTIVPMWQNVCGTLDNLFPPVNGGRLWYDTQDVAFMKEDQQDAADIQSTKSGSLNILITAGYTPESAVKAIVADDFTLLEHTGRFSVQLQPPGTGDAEDSTTPDGKPADAVTTGSTPVAPAANGNGRSSEFEVTDYMLQRLLADVEREKQPQPTHINITTPPTTVEIAEGAISSHVSLEMPSSEGSRTEFAEGAFQTHVSVEPSDVRVEPTSVTVEPAQITVEPADVRMELAEGAIQVGVEMPDVQVEVQPADVRTEIAEGAVQVSLEPSDVHVTVEAAQTDINIEPARAADQPAPVVNVNVDPTPLQITNEIKQGDKLITFRRDSEGAIVEAESEDSPSTDGEGG